jgi:RND family efflux transporter MFP subunit
MIKKVALLLLLSGAIISCSKKTEVADDTRYVKIFVVGGGVDKGYSTFHGNIHAEYEPNLSFRVNGKIVIRLVDIGQFVKKGQALAKLDPTDYKLSADSATAQLASAKSNYVTQEANLERYKQLLKQNFVSQAQYDSQKAQFDSAKAQYEEANNQLANSKNQVQYTTLVAPSDGVISSINMDAGQVVSAGQTVATMAVSGNKEVAIDLPEAQINDYKIGMPADVRLWATNKNYVGKIRIINQASDQQTRTYAARVVVLNAESDVKYGMSADVTIKPLNSTDGVVLPINSLYTNNGKTGIWLLDANSKAKFVPVEVIATDGNTMKVKRGIINNGDKIVSAGANFVYEGQQLKVYSD